MLCSVFKFRFGHCLLHTSHSFLFKFFKGNHISVAEWADTYGILYWRIFRASNRKLSCMGLEATITILCLDALTNWAISFKLHSELILYSYSRVSSFVRSSAFLVFAVLVIRPVYLNGSSERPSRRFNQSSYQSMSYQSNSYLGSTLYSCYFNFFFCSVFRFHFHYCLYYMWLLF